MPPSSFVRSRVAALALVVSMCGCGPEGGGTGEVASQPTEPEVLVPEIDGEWWQVAGSPDLGEFTSDDQENTSFGLWRAADGSWQLWGCIRKTNVGGNTRLFHRWEGASITDSDWTPRGIAMTARTDLGETAGGIQAPHADRFGDDWVMVYGDWDNICIARSDDGKEFTRQIGDDGRAGAFNEGLGNKTRDPAIIKVGDTYYVYYTANPGQVGAVYARTSTDLRSWSAPTIVSAGGSAGSGWDDAEVPVVLYLEIERAYYLFRTHSIGDTDEYMTSVYRSPDPLDFGVNDDRFLVTTMQTEAARIVKQGEQYYIASVLPGRQGYRVARLRWVRR